MPAYLILYWRMIRPGFLTITLSASLLGIAATAADGVPLRLGAALLTVLLACIAHAAANVWNDYCDAKNGADDANLTGIFPFTGGARLIQQGQVSAAATARWGLALMGLLVLAGLPLAVSLGPDMAGLTGLGMVGLLLAWAYSAPPLALMSRGLGEAAVALAWALVVAGADYVQRGHFAAAPCAAGWSMGLLVANILLINGLPDARADAQAGKRTLAVRLGPARLAWAYLVIALASQAGLALAVIAGWLPAGALAGLIALPVSLTAAQKLRRHAHDLARLRGPIILTIIAANLYALAAAAGLMLAR